MVTPCRGQEDQGEGCREHPQEEDKASEETKKGDFEGDPEDRGDSSPVQWEAET